MRPTQPLRTAQEKARSRRSPRRRTVQRRWRRGNRLRLRSQPSGRTIFPCATRHSSRGKSPVRPVLRCAPAPSGCGAAPSPVWGVASRRDGPERQGNQPDAPLTNTPQTGLRANLQAILASMNAEMKLSPTGPRGGSWRNASRRSRPRSTTYHRGPERAATRVGMSRPFAVFGRTRSSALSGNRIVEVSASGWKRSSPTRAAFLVRPRGWRRPERAPSRAAAARWGRPPAPNWSSGEGHEPATAPHPASPASGRSAPSGTGGEARRRRSPQRRTVPTRWRQGNRRRLRPQPSGQTIFPCRFASFLAKQNRQSGRSSAALRPLRGAGGAAACLGGRIAQGRSRAPRETQTMPRPTSTLPAHARYALVTHVAELQAELASISCPRERRTIQAELKAAQTRVAQLPRRAKTPSSRAAQRAAFYPGDRGALPWFVARGTSLRRAPVRAPAEPSDRTGFAATGAAASGRQAASWVDLNSAT